MHATERSFVTDLRTYEQTERQTDRQTDRRMDGRIDTPFLERPCAMRIYTAKPFSFLRVCMTGCAAAATVDYEI